jgi:ribosomal protein L30/L7E
MVYLVIRIRGIVNIPSWAEKTLENLNLRKKFNATIVTENNL